MPAIIKNELRVLNADAFMYTITNNPTYVFISGTEAWEDELNPPTPVDNTRDEYFSLSDIIGVKRILANDVIPVVPRTNWQENVIYDQYDHDVDLVNSRNPITGDFYRYYVVTEDFNVYKCLSNNYRSPSTARPTGTIPEPIQTPDGYIWKYMYTIQASDAFKFMTSNWMPCYTLTYNNGSSQWNSQQSAIPGTIDNIEIKIKGAGYSAVNPPSITIVGDGEGASAMPVVNPVTGEIDDIIVTDRGRDYTHATVSITDVGGSGVGAEARAIIGPRLGHGHDPKVELGATYLMVKVTLDGDEGGIIPADVTYRTSGILFMPGADTEGLAIKLVDNRARLFNAGETVTGSVTNTTGTIAHVDYINGILYVNNVSGTFLQTELLSSNPSNGSAIQTISSGFLPMSAILGGPESMKLNTGKILFISNREKITRIKDQKEDVIAVLSF